MKTFMFAAFAALAMVAAPAAAQTTYNADPTVAFNYGVGNNYVPANAAVLDSGTSELAARFHVPFVATSPSSDNGTYFFNLGSDASFDYSYSNFLTGSFSLTNFLTGQTYNTGTFTLANALLQDSQRLSFGFLSSLGFDPNVNNTYQLDLTGTNSLGTSTLTTYAQFGTGAVAAVPEPGTWAMMLIGFGGTGVALRRRRRTNRLMQVA